MLKFDFTRSEYDKIIDELMLDDYEQRVMEYRIRNYSIVKMAELEHRSERTISRTIEKLKKKVKKII